MSKRVQKKVKKTRKGANSESNSASSKRVKMNQFDHGYFSWELRKDVRNKRYNARELLYNLNFLQYLRGGVGNVLNAIGQMYKHFWKNSNLKWRIMINRLVIISPELRDPLWLPYATVADLNVEDILQYKESVAKQSTLLPTQGCHHLCQTCSQSTRGKGGVFNKIMDNDACCEGYN